MLRLWQIPTKECRQRSSVRAQAELQELARRREQGWRGQEDAPSSVLPPRELAEKARAGPPLPASAESQRSLVRPPLPGRATQAQGSAQVPSPPLPARQVLVLQPCAGGASEPLPPNGQPLVWLCRLFSWVSVVWSWQAPPHGQPHQRTEGDPCLIAPMSGFQGSFLESAAHQSFVVLSVLAVPEVPRVAASRQNPRQNNCPPPPDQSRNAVAAEASVRLVAGSPQAQQQTQTAQPV